MDPTEIAKFETLHERTAATIDTLLNRALQSLTGVERTVVGQAAQLIYPRVQRKLHEVTETQLRDELVYFQSLLNAILQDAPTQDSVRKRHRTQARKRRPPAGKRR